SGGHSTSDDPSAYRDDAEVAAWAHLDPIERLREHLLEGGVFDRAEDDALERSFAQELDSAIKKAEQKPKPPRSSLFEGVYAKAPWHLREQAEECERHAAGGGAE